MLQLHPHSHLVISVPKICVAQYPYPYPPAMAAPVQRFPHGLVDYILSDLDVVVGYGSVDRHVRVKLFGAVTFGSH